MTMQGENPVAHSSPQVVGDVRLGMGDGAHRSGLGETLAALVADLGASMGILGLVPLTMGRDAGVPGGGSATVSGGGVVTLGLEALSPGTVRHFLRTIPGLEAACENTGGVDVSGGLLLTLAAPVVQAGRCAVGSGGLLPPEQVGHALWMVVDGAAGGGAVVLLRGAGQPPFAESEQERLVALGPYLGGVIDLMARLDACERRLRAAEDALDALTVGLIVTDGQGVLMEANSTARRCLDSGRGLRLEGGVVTSSDERWASRLATLIGDAARSARHGEAWPGVALRLAEGSGSQGLGVVVMPLVRQEGEARAGAKPLVLLYLSESQDQDGGCPSGPEPALTGPLAAPVAANVLRGLYGLTAAEAALLYGLLQDKRLEDYASERGVSVTTVRTQLATLFRKTGTSRQSELVRLAHAAIGFIRHR